MEIDPTDAQILRALQGNARLSFRKLARLVGVSVPTVSARVARLEELGVLAGYHAAVDPGRLGHLRLVVVVTCLPAKVDEVGGMLASRPEVRWTIRTDTSRIVAEFILPGGSAMKRVLSEVGSLDGVRKVEPHVSSRDYKDNPGVPFSGRLNVVVKCFECGKVIDANPIRWRAGGRTHYLCCASCEKLYKERYRRIRAAR